MASMQGWLGMYVKVDCRNLGIFEGKVANIDGTNQIIVLEEACMNGKSVHSNEVQICASDIKNLEILSAPPEQAKVRKTSGGSASKQSGIKSTPSKAEPSPAKHGKSKKSSTFPGDKSITPRKNQNAKSKSLKEKDKECFGQSLLDMMTPDFDFEKNLANFDKKAVFEEIESSGSDCGVRKGFKEFNLKPTESVLEHEPVIQRQICVPSEHRGKEFLSDNGIVVPAVSIELKNTLFEMSEQMGLSQEQRIECAGMCAFQMAMQVLGGSRRFNNLNDMPSVVVMAGPHIQGLQGICTARHLANKKINVTLFIPRKTQELIPQLALYMHTGGRLASSVKDFPQFPVDLVIDALLDHEKSSPILEQTLNAVEWANDNKAPVLAIDPCEFNAVLGLEVKWSLALALPLVGTPKTGRLFLGDVGIPKGVFASAGIKYISPFTDKIVIPLNDR
ncbi:enhancer of mRNA-decapping protein 3 [Exaiptasia diaphana]|uniref:Enhancer of mRNA-decapping protein 3 n=1 Tax=Exaiptasia diaphana TaxID=2652724 RepID=A0A913XG81_EXADI|nr:enhancer of mRNA-decapping protein 3 [Exaiptasia diaphana]KXJ12342.1 Enhancer of mRNA-decapping protein 3 [Exaiptasia diaphana]